MSEHISLFAQDFIFLIRLICIGMNLTVAFEATLVRGYPFTTGYFEVIGNKLRNFVYHILCSREQHI